MQKSLLQERTLTDTSINKLNWSIRLKKKKKTI